MFVSVPVPVPVPVFVRMHAWVMVMEKEYNTKLFWICVNAHLYIIISMCFVQTQDVIKSGQSLAGFSLRV